MSIELRDKHEELESVEVRNFETLDVTSTCVAEFGVLVDMGITVKEVNSSDECSVSHETR